MTTFNGFPKETEHFYKELSANNNKEWFEENKEIYEKYVLTPARDFVSAMGEKLKIISPGIHADPRINKSLFKIHRDVRFSSDKTPFKTHLGIWFWEGRGKRMECSGFYFHIEPGKMILGAGIPAFSKNLLAAYRDSVVDEKHGNALLKTIRKISKENDLQIGGRHFKKTPRGYDSEHPNAQWLLYNGLLTHVESSIPEEIHSDKIMDYALYYYSKMAPLHQWLLDLTLRTP